MKLRKKSKASLRTPASKNRIFYSDMKHLVTACLSVFSFLLPALAAETQTAQAVLSRMDQAAPSFQAMSADVKMTTFISVIKDTTVDEGTLVMQRLKGGAVRAILDFSHQKDRSANRVIAFLGNIVRMYYPNANTYQDYDVGKNTDVLNQFLLLGFGSSGKELAQSYTVTAAGAETINGQAATKLLLVPRVASMKEKLSKIEVWIPTNAAYPIQQEFYEPAPSENYRIVNYSGVNLKPAIKGKQLDFKLPPKAKKSS